MDMGDAVENIDDGKSRAVIYRLDASKLVTDRRENSPNNRSAKSLFRLT